MINPFVVDGYEVTVEQVCVFAALIVRKHRYLINLSLNVVSGNIFVK